MKRELLNRDGSPMREYHSPLIEELLNEMKKRTLIIYNTKETTEEEAKHLLEILNCDDSTLWDNADHCGVQIIEVPLENGRKK
jgi:hypothetical protein